jgi:serine/threonine-protein kinase
MEYLEGTDFSDLRKQKGTLEVAEAVGYLLEACAAIAEAHTLGIVHRDLKPSNLFLQERKDGIKVVKVLDFGISKLEGPDEHDTTKTGQMMGSPRYMSPEQMLSMRDVDGRSDIWSLGAILYEFLTGRPPFVAETTPRTCALVLGSDPVMPSALRPDLPIELERAVLRCLEKEPGRRFANVAAFAEAIAPFAPPRDSMVRTTGSRQAALLPASNGSRLPSATPTPAAWDGETKLEGAPRKVAPNRRRIAVVIAGAVLVIGSPIVLRAAMGDSEVVAVGAPSGDVTAGSTTTAAVVVTPADPGKKAYTLGDLPDVPASAGIAPKPAPPNASRPHPGEPGSAVKKIKPAGSADPFAGRRN